MRTTIHLIIFCFVLTSVSSQTLITDKDKTVWTFKNGYTYDFEWTNEASDDKFFTDTIYAIQFFPKRNDWKVYFDATKTKIATLIHYDTINKTINTKHFNRQGKLIKELEARYFSRKSYNPAFINVKNVIYLKAYHNDSLIYEIRGFNTSLLFKYKNYLTKRHFEKRIYYREGEYNDEEIGDNTWDYYENGAIKSICNSYIEDEMSKDGVNTRTRIFKCEHFDKNGCIIMRK